MYKNDNSSSNSKKYPIRLHIVDWLFVKPAIAQLFFAWYSNKQSLLINVSLPTFEQG
jgi:hypothetical protein